MMELPEVMTLAAQLNDTVRGLRIEKAVAGTTPHGFAFYSHPVEQYPTLLEGRTLGVAEGHGAFITLAVEDNTLLLGDGANLRWYEPGAKAKLPPKHQLLLELSGGGALVTSVQMYGGMWVFEAAKGCDNPYYQTALAKPSPLEDGFSEAYFLQMADEAKQNLSAKAFLATEQRIPGLGNGTLQDILWAAKVHPKTKLSALDNAARGRLYAEVAGLLRKMTGAGGRDTEKDLYGNPGGYVTVLSAKTAGKPCPDCGTAIVKQAYLGGSIYFCPSCQR